MKEYGGYIELDTYNLPMLHGDAVALNCGRNCLAYLINAKGIKKIVIPYFLCNSVKNLCKRENVQIRYYHINESFLPENVDVQEDEWLYIVNYYGQLKYEQICTLKQKYARIIVDNAQDYFQMPVSGVDTLYTCRKFFGIADGAFLYTDARLDVELPIDESFERMHFLLGRFERTASEFYMEYVANNELFGNEPIKRMSKLTNNLLHGIDYGFVKQRRTDNFRLYHENLKCMNQLELKEVEGAFAYPMLIDNGAEVRKGLQQKKIYIPTLWPNVLDNVNKNLMEYKFAENILPLPCDQRYAEEDIQYIVKKIGEYRI